MMFYVCVICMVSVKKDPLMELTGELRQIWQRMIAPNSKKIRKLTCCYLLACSECKQLLKTILKFRSTINIGADYLLSLYKTLEKPVLSQQLPQVINFQSDLLRVVNEEVVLSTESWDDIESARPVPSNTNATRLPRILVRRPAQHVPEDEDYAVLIPNGGLRGWKPVQPPGASLLKGPHATERNDSTTEDRGSLLLGLRATAPSDATTQVRASLLQGPRATAPSDATTQVRASLLQGPRATAPSDATTQVRVSLLHGPHTTVRNDATTQDRVSLLQRPRATAPSDATTQDRASLLQGPRAKARSYATTQLRASFDLQGTDGPGLPEAAQCIRPPLLIAVNEKTPNLLCVEDVAYSSEFSETSKIEEAIAMPKDAEEATNITEDKVKLNRQLFDAIKATLQSSLTEEFDIKYEPEPDLGHDSDLGAEPDSESTVSCQSNYEDPETYPNIIFARAFDGISAKDPRTIRNGLETEGKAEDLQIHSHIVTNPPSEWPCTWESCQLQGLDDEYEDLESPTDTPRNEQITRSKRKSYTRRFKCKLCGKSFSRKRILFQHYEREHEQPVKCNMCYKEFRGETELKFHKIKHQIKITADFEEYSTHMCVECGTRCSGPVTLQRHALTRKHAAVALWRFQCDICKRKFPDKKRIAGHIQREHLAKEAVKCPMCTATFKSARSLRRHATVHILAQAQENMYTSTEANGQARKRRRTTHTKAEDLYGNTLANEEHRDTLTNGRRKKPRKTTHTKAKTYNKRKRQENPHTDINIQVNKHTDKQTNRQRKTTEKNSLIRKYSNRQDNTHTYTSINGQESTQQQIHLNGQTLNTQSTHRNTPTDIQTNGQNTDSHKITRNANGRVRKRRKKCPYIKRKRACTRAPTAQKPAVAKTSLFDMLSSFIL